MAIWFQEREALRTIECLVNGRYEELIKEVDPLEWKKASEFNIRMLLVQIMRIDLYDLQNLPQLLGKIGRCLEEAPRDVLTKTVVDFMYKNYPDVVINHRINYVINICPNLREDLEAELVRRELS